MIAEEQVSTLERINTIAFRYLLEKGYEATNMRTISDEVGIKASSLYFYYKSKKEMFIHIYNSIYEGQLQRIKKSINLNKDLSSEEQLYLIFKNGITACVHNSAPYRFILRYQLFPAEELPEESRNLLYSWLGEELQLLKPIIQEYMQSKHYSAIYNEELLFHRFKMFQNSIINEMIISGIAVEEEILDFYWNRIWNDRDSRKQDI